MPELTTLEKIALIVGKYQAIPADFKDISRLTTWSQKLACCLFDYAGEVGDLYKAAKGAEYARKAAFEKKRLELIEAGKSAAAAEAEAKAGTTGDLFNETCADADYRAAFMQYSAARDVLEAMRQHIASLKQEHRLEMTGQGSQ